MAPVKVFSVNEPLDHLRHGAPERSRARRPALMAPSFAFGPRFGAALVIVPSVVPSSLLMKSVLYHESIC